MIWVVAIVVAAVLFAFAWWSSGRAPGRRRFRNPSQHDEAAQFESTVVHRNGGGIGGPLG